MKTFPHRIVIYPKDVTNITGMRQRTAGKLLNMIRQENGKSRSAFVTLYEFARFTEIDEEYIRPFLR